MLSVIVIDIERPLAIMFNKHCNAECELATEFESDTRKSVYNYLVERINCLLRRSFGLAAEAALLKVP